MHGGFIWLNKKISIDSYLVAQVIGLQKDGVDPAYFFVGKVKDKELANRMKEKYNPTKNNRDYDVAFIKNTGVHFTTKALLSKVLRECHPINQVQTSIMAMVEQCVEGVQMTWATFPLNELLSDCMDV